ncbi:SDR family NAD(P)-dependent oxidoreductase [Gryllotalpicola protaetiae]|uniref:SDR family oxidoreductase n=1 Tax=Gryllotalpicola protaetiae TaxID=2419771 RepID=A0A387BZZ5_9MICO|nr:SDR family oxidoreductase [Gryllotalpicola protaetiae]AYG03901.1 SDR family oxidoreductase [Gryllotalpicola protaetiae]
MAIGLGNQTVVVLGGTSGIGYEVARQAHAAGATVLITGRDQKRLDAATRSLPGTTGSRFDVTNRDELAAFLAAAEAPIGHVFVGAGSPYYALLADLDAHEAAHAVGGALELMINLAQLAAPRMAEGGTLLFMGGTAARHPAPGLTAIGASIGATSAAVANLALEIAPVRMNLIAAGFVDTPLSARLLGENLEVRRQELRSTLPIRRVVQATDVASLAIHLMENTAITGAVIDIDGGQQLLPTVGA